MIKFFKVKSKINIVFFKFQATENLSYKSEKNFLNYIYMNCMNNTS